MTIMVQNMASSVSGTSASGKASGAGKTAAGASFDTTLTYQMSGGSSTTSTSTEVAAKLESLLANISSETGDGSLEGLMELLQGLLQELDAMDQALVDDPTLLQELQTWLTQANQVLIGAAPQAQGNIDGNETSPLASSPETIRFAVQDTLNQLTEMLRMSTTLAMETEDSLKRLIQMFQSVFDKNAGNVNVSVEKNLVDQIQNGQSDQSGKHVSLVESTPVKLFQAGVQQQSLINDRLAIRQTNLAQNPGELIKNDVFSTSTQLTQRIVVDPKAGFQFNGVQTPQIEGETKVIGSLAVEDGMLPEHGNITAGQLALRSGMHVLISTSEPQVPVTQFAKEMTTFIINKLEFVKQQGFTEARISLNPEHLGQVDIKLTMQNGHLVAQFMTRSTDTKELIDQQMAQLRSSLLAQGLQVEKIEVTQSSQPSTTNLYQDGRQPGSGQQQSQHRSKEKDRPSDDAVLAANLTEEWNDWISENQSEDGLIQAGTFTAKA